MHMLIKHIRSFRVEQIYKLQVSSYRTKGPVFGHNPSKYINVSQGQTGLECLQSPSPSSLSLRCLVDAFRQHGHQVAAVNPLLIPCTPTRMNILQPEVHGLRGSASLQDADNLFNYIGKSTRLGTVSDLEKWLHKTYCSGLAVETSHIMELGERAWFCKAFEEISEMEVPASLKVNMAILMRQSQVFDTFLATRYSTTKRYGGEGAEAMMVFFNELFYQACDNSLKEVVMCMPHRGRLNLLTILLKFPPVHVFQKILGMREWPEGVRGTGDVLSHLSNNATVNYPHGDIYVTMIPNPSHLEANNPVAVGKARARQRTLDDGAYSPDNRLPGDKVLCLQVHGDASFAGQGIVPETLGLSGVPHFNVGGSIHLIVNNQLGFTTEAECARTSEYASCIAKMNSLPIIRVNGESPEAVLKAAQVAMAYRMAYRKDIIVDMMCYRRWGHNELDDPSFTQPLMYADISSRRPLPESYADHLVSSGVCPIETIGKPVEEWKNFLQDQFTLVNTALPKANHLEKHWRGLVQAADVISVWDTGVEENLLKYVGAKSVELPEGFAVHPTLVKSHVQKRLQKVAEGTGLDWATAEAMAFGSLLCQGYDVRLCGQDVGRGTFSNRHAMLVDQVTDGIYIPLNHIHEKQTNFLEICNSTLSEEAVLGFEYGFSIESPNRLPIWEAQFGDFFNGAQIIIDTYVSSGEAKWLLQSGLVLLLPTGMDGAGPEHSSCRVERFLQMVDSKEDQVDGDAVNMSVCHPTTPAQYFHLLRRQMLRNFRKPLVIASPKVLLRLPAATSNVREMIEGTSFRPVLPDIMAKPDLVKKVLFCFGKHFYALDTERKARSLEDIAIIRVEEACPFPVSGLQQVLAQYPNATKFVWAQEEHRNAGAWSFVKPRFEALLGIQLQYAGRDVLATPATGIGLNHKAESLALMEISFGK